MLWHNFKYAFKTLLMNKSLVFWTFIFPLVLATFFYLAFSNFESSEKLKIIDIAVVEDVHFVDNEIYKEAFSKLSEPNKDSLFNTTFTTEKVAKELLAADKITGYVLLGDNTKVVVARNGVYQTVLNNVVREIGQLKIVIENIVNKTVSEELTYNPCSVKNIDAIYQRAYLSAINNISRVNNSLEDVSNKNMSYIMIEYYSLIAMSCLYGALLSLISINQNLPNMSSKGKRVAISPVSKYKLILSSFLASYLVQIIGISILFVYMTALLNINLGSNLFYTIILTLVGALAGSSLGMVIATTLKTSDNNKTGLVIAISMASCFFSGMMGVSMKYIIDKNIPLINLLNPAAMITDGLYALYYYQTFARYNFNLISLFIFTCLMFSIAAFSLRRQKYDSV